MDWYYAEKRVQKGPLSEKEFEQLVRDGTIRPDTLVWHSGLTSWVPWAQVAHEQTTDPAGTPPESGEGTLACVECGRMFLPSAMVAYGDHWVCATCKPVFFQKIREGTALQGQYRFAGFWIRFAAKFIDGIILYVFNILGALGGALMGAQASEPLQLTVMLSLQLLGFLVQLAYYVFFHSRYGATPGKMVCRLQVITPEGHLISYGRATGRFFAEMLSGIILGIGYIMVAFDDEKRSLHDRICDTRVVYK